MPIPVVIEQGPGRPSRIRSQNLTDKDRMIPSVVACPQIAIDPSETAGKNRTSCHRSRTLHAFESVLDFRSQTGKSNTEFNLIRTEDVDGEDPALLYDSVGVNFLIQADQ